MTGATLVVPDDALKQVEVEVTLRLSLEDCAAVADNITTLAARSNDPAADFKVEWALLDIGRTLRSLREDAERSIRGLKFKGEVAPADGQEKEGES